MSKGFRYYAQPDEIKAFLADQGYLNKPLYDRENKLIGYTIADTFLEFTFPLVVGRREVAYGTISLRRRLGDNDPGKAVRSKTLYHKLRLRFGKRDRAGKLIPSARYLSMDDDVVVVFYGIRVDVDADSPEVDHLEDGTHPLMQAAEQFGLDHWWSGFPNDDELSYPVLIGRRLGVLGGEYPLELRVPTRELVDSLRDIPEKLRQAGLHSTPTLLLKVEVE